MVLQVIARRSRASRLRRSRGYWLYAAMAAAGLACAVALAAHPFQP